MRIIVTLILLAFWAAASSHTLLETCGLIHQDHSDHHFDSKQSQDDHEGDHEAADGHCVLASTQTAVPVLGLMLCSYLLALVLLDWDFESRVAAFSSGLAPPGAAPLQLSHRWQFSLRTALPPRAPSFIS